MKIQWWSAQMVLGRNQKKKKTPLTAKLRSVWPEPEGLLNPKHWPCSWCRPGVKAKQKRVETLSCSWQQTRNVSNHTQHWEGRIENMPPIWRSYGLGIIFWKMIFDPFRSVDPDGLKEHKLLRNGLNLFSSLLLANLNALFVGSYGFHSINQKCFNMISLWVALNELRQVASDSMGLHVRW